MKGLRKLTHAAVVLACCGMMIPQQAVRAAAPARPAVSDVAMSTGGKLTGSVVNREGTVIDGAIVVISQRDKEVTRVTTDAQGAFAVAGLRGGTYQVQVGDSASVVRAWTADSAPPSARPQAILVTGDTVRGQGMGGVDIITLWTVGAATGALIVAVINQQDINDVNDKLDDLASP